jgi:hypothetical protein
MPSALGFANSLQIRKIGADDRVYAPYAPDANAYAERWVGSVRPGVPRPAPDLRPPPARARPARLHPPLQPAASSPSARPATAGLRKRNRSFAHSDDLSTAGQATRLPWRSDPRIQSRGVKIEFVHPTRSCARAPAISCSRRPGRESYRRSGLPPGEVISL